MENMMTLKIGNKAPAFNSTTDTGDKVKLADFKGQKVVLYFYPKDSTPGCTIEAKDFRDLIRDYKKSGAVILGVSKDSVTKHQKFKSNHDLPFTLLSDPDATLCEAYGVYVEKSMFGKKYMGIERSTFLIDEAGKIQQIWRKVKVKDHAKAVLMATQSLTQPA